MRKRWHILVAIVLLAACRILHDSLIPITPTSAAAVAPTTQPVEEHASDELGWRTEWLKWLLVPADKPLDAPAQFASSESGPSNGDGDSNVWMLGDRLIGVMTITGSQTINTTSPNRGPVVTVLGDGNDIPSKSNQLDDFPIGGAVAERSPSASPPPPSASPPPPPTIQLPPEKQPIDVSTAPPPTQVTTGSAPVGSTPPAPALPEPVLVAYVLPLCFVVRSPRRSSPAHS